MRTFAAIAAISAVALFAGCDTGPSSTGEDAPQVTLSYASGGPFMALSSNVPGAGVAARGCPGGSGSADAVIVPRGGTERLRVEASAATGIAQIRFTFENSSTYAFEDARVGTSSGAGVARTTTGATYAYGQQGTTNTQTIYTANIPAEQRRTTDGMTLSYDMSSPSQTYIVRVTSGAGGVTTQRVNVEDAAYRC
ncbi:hypothetical protein [Pseudoroseicyclus sp. CXY001]|uniref:hypothetical protein n=1 Tax=Pseudoroseicyclus sp. CXY001 TaxID=3242492 RepID=UPI003570BC38